MVGDKHGRWTVISNQEFRKYTHHIAYLCRCECGTERVMSRSLLQRGTTLSCGCLGRDVSKIKNRKHGLWRHRLYGVWRSMKERCYNPNHDAYARYGGRGIVVCRRWISDPERFIRDNEARAKPGLTLDRINNDGPYSPENCRWVDRRTQTLNRHNNRILEFRGKRQTLAEWSAHIGIAYRTLHQRLAIGWTIPRALTEPVRQKSPGT